MTWLGLIGGPLIILTGTLVLFGVTNDGGALKGIVTIPEAVWELFLGVYCTVKGFQAVVPDPSQRLWGSMRAIPATPA